MTGFRLRLLGAKIIKNIYVSDYLAPVYFSIPEELQCSISIPGEVAVMSLITGLSLASSSVLRIYLERGKL